MFVELWILAAIFAPLFVAFIVAIVTLHWRQSSIPPRVKRVEDAVDELREESKRLERVAEQVRGLTDRVDRESKRDETEHKALAEGIQAVTNHLLDIKKMNGGAVSRGAKR